MGRVITTCFSFALLFSACTKPVELTSFKDEKTGFFGFKDGNQKEVVPPQFSMVIEPTKGEDLIPVVKDGKFFRMDKSGNLKFESFVFDNAWDYYEEGLARFISNKKMGFHNEKGEVVIDAKYDFAFGFKNGNAIVCEGCSEYRPLGEEHATLKGGKWGAVDLKGNPVLPIEYDDWDAVVAALAKQTNSKK